MRRKEKWNVSKNEKQIWNEQTKNDFIIIIYVHTYINAKPYEIYCVDNDKA